MPPHAAIPASMAARNCERVMELEFISGLISYAVQMGGALLGYEHKISALVVVVKVTLTDDHGEARSVAADTHFKIAGVMTRAVVVGIASFAVRSFNHMPRSLCTVMRSRG